MNVFFARHSVQRGSVLAFLTRRVLFSLSEMEAGAEWLHAEREEYTFC
jgi:hypothetical protein